MAKSVSSGILRSSDVLKSNSGLPSGVDRTLNIMIRVPLGF